MKNKRKLNAWIRLWILCSVLWSMLVIAFTILDWRHFSDAVWIPLLFWLVPCLFFLGLGWGIAWVCQGLTLDRQYQPSDKSMSVIGMLVSILRRMFV